MPLSPGERLGPYEVVSAIGAGGMGEVYKARDTRLDRTVAIKVASEEFGDRFRREARAIAALNHPHICTIHDVGPSYLVMEYIEGAEIRGPLPVAEALRLAIQIGEALEHAHRHGVIHRDLKPANILVTRSGAKVLDFGLAKLSGTAMAVDTTFTEPGTILGTPRYMPPEQIEGREADQRSDIFAFGLILYELLTGQPAFQGETHANLIAAILTAQPQPIDALQPLIPPALVHLVDTCLAKDPNERRQTMHDVLLELRWIAAAGSQAGTPAPLTSQRKRLSLVSWTLAATGIAASLWLGVVHFREEPAPADPVRFEIPLPPRTGSPNWWDFPAISPDGRAVAYTAAERGSATALWLRRLDSVQPAALPGTEGATQPFWSPDSRYIAYFAAGKLWKIDSQGGPPQPLCDAPLPIGGSWNRDGVILMGRERAPLHQLAPGASQAVPVPQPAAQSDPGNQCWPHFLPDGRHFLYVSFPVMRQATTYLGSLDGDAPRRLFDFGANASFSAPGFLLFGRGPVLMAQPFNPKTLQLSGEAVPVVDTLVRPPASLGQTVHAYSSSPGGALVYRTESPTAGTYQMAWWSRTGTRIGTVGEPQRYSQGTLSPNEKTFAAQVASAGGGQPAIWLMSLSSGILSRLTTAPGTKSTVQWSPDGQEVLFSSANPRAQLYRMAVGGTEERLVPTTGENVYPSTWLPDGSIIFQNVLGRTFYRLPPAPGAKPEALLTSDYSKDELRISPDGRWAIYNANESGRWEVYVAAFPSFAQKRQVSVSGGAQGFWRKDGRELFYLSLDGKMMSVPVQPGATLETGSPTMLFQTRLIVDPKQDQYAVTSDGQRFLTLDPIDSGVNSLTVVLNWPATLKSRTPSR